MRNPNPTPFFLLIASLLAVHSSGSPAPINSNQLIPTTVPSFPVVQALNQTACRLDLSDELFGGVADACGHGTLDRGRCCPVLAAWLFAAHARSALEIRTPPAQTGLDSGPVMPDDAQRCVDSLQESLEGRDIRIPRPNATCDAVICFCGIRLHQIGSLTCPAAFNVSGGGEMAAPKAAVRDLERHCRNASYAGCTKCLQSLEKVKAGGGGGDHGRESRMFGRDCQLMGLTWLLARNKTAFIPTVSAVLRAVLYSAHPPTQPYKCSPDQDDMPLAVDSLQFQKLDSSSASSRHDIFCNFIMHSVPVFVLASLACHLVLVRGS